jgi:hypothetical protein
MRPKPLHRCSRGDFVNLLAAIFASDPAPHPRVPTRLWRCTAPAPRRRWCEEAAYAGRIGPSSFQCTMSPIGHDGTGTAPPSHDSGIRTATEIVDGIYVETCPYRSPSPRPGPAVPSGSWHIRSDGYDDAAVEWTRATVTLLAFEDSPMGRVALGIVSDDMSVVDGDLDTRWLHSQPRLDSDERRNLWRREAQERLAAHLKRTSRPRDVNPATLPVGLTHRAERMALILA